MSISDSGSDWATGPRVEKPALLTRMSGVKPSVATRSIKVARSGPVGEISGQDTGPPAACPDFVGQRRQPVSSSSHECYAVPPGGQFPSDGFTNPRGGAGHDGGAISCRWRKAHMAHRSVAAAVPGGDGPATRPQPRRQRPNSADILESGLRSAGEARVRAGPEDRSAQGGDCRLGRPDSTKPVGSPLDRRSTKNGVWPRGARAAEPPSPGGPNAGHPEVLRGQSRALRLLPNRKEACCRQEAGRHRGPRLRPALVFPGCLVAMARSKNGRPNLRGRHRTTRRAACPIACHPWRPVRSRWESASPTRHWLPQDRLPAARRDRRRWTVQSHGGRR